MILVLLGPDGSGKSTLINLLTPALSAGGRHVRYVHFRPSVMFRKSQQEGLAVRPVSGSPRTLFGSCLQISVWLSEYWLDAILHTTTRNTVTIFDRHFYDVVADPARYRYGGPKWLLSAMALLVPRPSLCLVLDAPTAVLQARKQEVSPAESEAARGKYMSLLSKLPNGVKLDATRPVDQNVTAVLGMIQAGEGGR